MLQITIPETELFDEARQEFIYVEKPTTLTLEHSLVSISKWEAKWKKPYLEEDTDGTGKTPEEIIDYIRCMTITQNVNPDIYYALTEEHFREIEEYIKDPHSATTFNEREKNYHKTGEGVTSELIYYWMCAYQIPFEAQKWHFNRLMNLIRIAGIKNRADNKMSKQDVYKQQRELNALRRAKANSKG